LFRSGSTNIIVKVKETFLSSPFRQEAPTANEKKLKTLTEGLADHIRDTLFSSYLTCSWLAFPV
jgi:hypothetical protein